MADKLVSMKIDQKAREEKYSETVAVERPVYPWGLSVSLDDEALEKLGLDELPKVGKSMMLIARVDVTSVSENENRYEGKPHKHRSVSLQITDMCLEAESSADAAGSLYDGGKAE